MSKHITEKQRYAISKMLQVPMSKKDIAEAIGVDKSSIYREIKRKQLPMNLQVLNLQVGL